MQSDPSDIRGRWKFYCKLLAKQREERAISQKTGIFLKDFTAMGDHIRSVSEESSDTAETFDIVTR